MFCPISRLFETLNTQITANSIWSVKSYIKQIKELNPLPYSASLTSEAATLNPLTAPLDTVLAKAIIWQHYLRI